MRIMGFASAAVVFLYIVKFALTGQVYNKNLPHAFFFTFFLYLFATQ